MVKRSADFQGDVHVDGDLTVHGIMKDDGDEDDTYDDDDDSDKNNIDYYMSLSIFLRCSQGR